MTVLSDASLRAQLGAGRLVIDPLADGAVQPASLDLALAGVVLVPGPGQHVDLSVGRVPTSYRTVSLASEDCWLRPRESALGATHERVRVPDDLVGLLLGRSTLARLFLQVEAAGLLDPGYEGNPTVELVNQGPHTIRLYPGMPICQLVLLRLTTPATTLYGEATGARYQGDVFATPALPFKEDRRG